jgi:WD40 repeat protein
VAISKKGKYVATGAYDGTVKIYENKVKGDTGEFVLIHTIKPKKGKGAWVSNIQFDGKDKRMAVG